MQPPVQIVDLTGGSLVAGEGLSSQTGRLSGNRRILRKFRQLVYQGMKSVGDMLQGWRVHDRALRAADFAQPVIAVCLVEIGVAVSVAQGLLCLIKRRLYGGGRY